MGLNRGINDSSTGSAPTIKKLTSKIIKKKKDDQTQYVDCESKKINHLITVCLIFTLTEHKEIYSLENGNTKKKKRMT